MNKITYHSEIDLDDLTDFVKEIDGYFTPILSERLNIRSYSEKLKQNASIIVAKLDLKVIGILAFYCNAKDKKNAYFTLMGVKKEYRNYGIGGELVRRAICHVKELGFQSFLLKTWENSLAFKLYSKNGFHVSESKFDTLFGLTRVEMKLLLLNELQVNNIESPLEILNKIGADFNINLFTKRDDLIPFIGGGNKARKLKYIITKAIKNDFNAIVTTGSNQSNHLRATALYASKLGWKLISIIHDKRPKKFEGNLKLLKLSGAIIKFVDKKDVKIKMDNAMIELRDEGLNPLYIWGGGHCLEGSLAYYDAIKELKNQLGNIKPDFIVLTSGTGTTQAGIEIGVKQYLSNCKVLGVSIARDKTRAKQEIKKSMIELNKYLDNPVSIDDNIFIDDTKMGNGYEDAFPELIETIKWAAETEGLILDPTYTGKAFYGLKKYVEIGIIPKNSNVVFWHTGGIFNLMSSNLN